MPNGSEQQNGNTQLNGERNELNKRVSKLAYLGNTKKVTWNGRRRNRTI